MKYFFILIFVAISFAMIGQCENGRYREMIFGTVNTTTDVQYGSNINHNGDQEDLFMDIYQPNGDTEAARALIVLVHGGSFVGGSKDGDDVIYLAEDWAKMGFVVASIEYRIGVDVNLSDPGLPFTEAVVRGYHDAKAAVRFFRKNIQDEGNTYQLDTDKIYMAGISAGGFITLHNAYMDEEEEMPGFIDYTQEGLGGGLEGESGNAGYDSNVAGIVNICGALLDTAWIHPGDIPVCNFHGTEDNVVPFDTDMIYALGFVAVMEVDGSESIDMKADEVGLINCFEIYEDEGHVPHIENSAIYDTTLSISSNFLSHLICPNTIELDCSYRELMVVDIDEKMEENKSFKMWPNPTTERLYFSAKEVKKVHISIVNSLGVEVKNMTLGPRKLDSFSVKKLLPGIYFITLSSKNKEQKFKIIIQ